MKHLDLFSGIGGFALATEMVWDDVEHVFCDNEPFAQAVLSKHWPNAKIYGDIRTLTADSYRLDRRSIKRQKQPEEGVLGQCTQNNDREYDFDLLTGGFPCQPFSQAGARRGTEDDRHLWPEMLRVIREFHPRWVIGENVGGLVTWSEGLVLEQIHIDLEAEGYEVQAFIIPAVSVNAPHRRDRVWIVANAKGSDASGDESRDDKRQILPEDGFRLRTEFSATDKNASNSESLNEERWSNRPGKEQFRRSDWEQNWSEVAARLCRVDDGLPKRLDRNPRLKGLGNAIVPQVAAEIFKVIKQLDPTL